jgi:ParB family chromosome partitioning protein
MTGRRRGGLGRGLGALIPTGPGTHNSPDSPDNPDRDEPDDGVNSGGAARTFAADDGADPTRSASAEPSTPAVQAAAAGPAIGGRPVGGTVGAQELVAVPGARFLEIDVSAVRANPKQPRTVFDEDALAELTHSVREFGILQPIVVRPVGDGFELVMGERRLRAATAAGLTQIPAIVRDIADDAMLRDALLENIHRAQLNPLEEAAAYQQLLEEFGVTHDELATRIGRSRSHVSNTIRLMNLSVPVQRRVAAGVLSAGHARALLGLPDGVDQDELAARIVAEGLSVRATEEVVALAVAHGGLDKPAVRRSARRIVAPAAADLAERLSDTFDTRVRVDIGRRKGRITVEFATIDDLERIVGLMAPGVMPNRARTEASPVPGTEADAAVTGGE